MEFGSNFEIYEEDNFAKISINPDIFSLEVIYSATYTFLDKAYFIFDGDPEEEVYVKVKPKEELNLEELVYKIQNEMVNYAVYIVQASRNQGVRNAIITRALQTNGVNFQRNEDIQEIDEEELIIEDDEGIAEAWSPEKESDIGNFDEEEISSSWKPEDEPEESSDCDIEIDQEKCINCGTCRTLAPESFEFDRDGKVTPVNQEIDENTRKAEKACPVDAIILREER